MEKGEPVKTHYVPPEIDATILSLCESLESLCESLEVDAAILSLCESLEALCESLEALCESLESLLEYADMGEIHDEETREVVEQAKCALASALALRLCVAH